MEGGCYKISTETEKTNLAWLSRSKIAYLKNIQSLNNLQLVFMSKGIFSIDVKPFGSDMVLLTFDTTDHMNSFLSNSQGWCPNGVMMFNMAKLTSILQLVTSFGSTQAPWSLASCLVKGLFKIGNSWEKFISMNNTTQSKSRLDYARILLLTNASGHAGRVTVWATDTVSESSVQLYLQDSGNLVLQSLEGDLLWQSFDFPTDTLLPLQPLSKDRKLVSSRSQSNYSSGFYKLYFDTDNVLHLLYAGPDFSSIYWPDPEVSIFDSGRTTYNNSRIAHFDPLGNFSSSDKFFFKSADYGANLQRRFTMDSDGNIRLYSREDKGGKWTVFMAGHISTMQDSRHLWTK
ncbi:hypothetical protein GH714_019359 [Hevea brasiliensis]|uniref:Bulb-type lectin domain-containing protein n=1 Tax=Hevea brasiliensis TaxID=3981 RepID=A0A6A6LAS0_HEVBR|nr:hypothetical protein GH714_019359 [Hevea brasiliensis]